MRKLEVINLARRSAEPACVAAAHTYTLRPQQGWVEYYIKLLHQAVYPVSPVKV